MALIWTRPDQFQAARDGILPRDLAPVTPHPAEKWIVGGMTVLALTEIGLIMWAAWSLS